MLPTEEGEIGLILKELRKERDRAQQYLDVAGVIFVVLDREGNVTLINRKGCDILGYSEEEVLGKSWFECYVPLRLRSDVQAAFRKIINGEIEPFEYYENPVLTRSGGEKIIAWHNTLIRDSSGAIISSLSSGEDITERQAAERKLRESEQEKAAILNAMKDNVIYHSRDLKVLWANKAACDYAGLKPEDIVGRSCFEIWHSKDESCKKCPLLKALETGMEHESEIINDSGEIWSLSGYPVKSETGEIVGLMEVARNVTDKRRAEAEIRKLNEELEMRVQFRTAQLEAANRDLEAFSYSVSHDLRAPLHTITGFSRVLIDELSAELSPEALSYLKRIDKSVLLMERLIRDLLAYSTTGRQSLNIGKVLPEIQVGEALEDLYGARKDRNVEIIIGSLPECMADPTLLKQVFLNLLSNSLKFTVDREQAKIEIGSYTHGDETVYFVRDNGIGFEEEDGSKLYQIFQRFHHSDRFDGTGVGLAIVQRILQRHGGRIWAESKIGEGATFYFTLGRESSR